MVQRKVPNKLGIQVDHHKPEKRLGNLRPSSPHHQDGKNRGADLKKKMKKSKSIKRSDFESLRSPTFRREVPQPGKPPPPLDVPAGAATPQKQSPIRGSDGSPNYMKSTSSFDARKERSQVNSRTSQTSIDSKSPRKIANNSKLGSSSDHKPGKTLTRTSSLKLVRTLTKSPSFKPARASTRKCSQVVLCENLNPQRQTCSSTLKDYKFPTYLALSPGATESEGTSAMKVCPYTYCSLNGHRHAPLPPLKCFLKARRHVLKTQKSMKLGCLSPRQAKPSGDGMKENTEKVSLDEKPGIQVLDSNSRAIIPEIQDDQMDFFIEIYVGDKEDAAETIDGSKQNGDDQDETNSSANDFILSAGQSNGAAESFSDEAPQTEMDLEDNLDCSREVISAEIEAAEEAYSPSSIQEEETPECPSNQSHLEVESSASAELDKTDSEISDMEWEEGNSAQTNNEYQFESGSSFGDDSPAFHNGTVFKSEDIVSSYFDEIPADVGLEKFFEEEDATSEAGCSSGSSNSEGQAFISQNYHDALEEATTEERDRNGESDDFVATAIIEAPIEEPIEEPTNAREDENKCFIDDKTEFSSNIKEEALIDHQENQYIQDSEACALLENQACDSSHNFPDPNHYETLEVYSSSDDSTEVYQSNAVKEEAPAENLLLLPKTEDPEPIPSLEQEFPTADAGDGMEEVQEDKTEENNEIQIGFTVKARESNQAFVAEGFTAETQVHSSADRSQTNKVAEDQNHSEKDPYQAQSFKISNSMDSEDQTHSGLNEVRVAENSNEEDVSEMEVEYSAMSDPEESLSSFKNAANTQVKTAFFRGGRHSTEELPKAPNNLRIIRCKRPAEELEDPRKFNPREPNYLTVEPDPDAEKVDLRHQMIDERKNAEEWMIDYALQQTVTKLAPARKKKVALLVEAFEKVMPIPKYEPHLRHTSPAFAHARPIQACS